METLGTNKNFKIYDVLHKASHTSPKIKWQKIASLSENVKICDFFVCIKTTLYFTLSCKIFRSFLAVTILLIETRLLTSSFFGCYDTFDRNKIIDF